MKIKLKQIVESVDAIKRLVDCKVPVKTAYTLSKIVTHVNRELEAFEGIRKGIIIEYGDKTENEGEYTFTIENAEIVNKKMQDVLDVDVDFPFEKINLYGLGDILIEAEVLMQLDWLVGE